MKDKAVTATPAKIEDLLLLRFVRHQEISPIGWDRHRDDGRLGRSPKATQSVNLVSFRNGEGVVHAAPDIPRC